MPLGTEPEKEERWKEPGWGNSREGEQSEIPRETEIKVETRGPEKRRLGRARGSESGLMHVHLESAMAPNQREGTDLK